MSGLAEALGVQRHAIHAMVLRNMRSRFAKSRFGFLIPIFEPVFMICVIYVLRVYARNVTVRDGVPMGVFLSTGYLVHYAFRHMTTDIAGALQRNPNLHTHSRMTVMDTVLGTAIGVWMTYTCVNIIISTMAVELTGANPPPNLLLVFIGFNGSMWMGFAMGGILGVIMRYIPSLRYVLAPLLRIDIFFSGAMFSADEVPPWLLPYISWNPVFHACEILREGWSPTYHSPIANPYYLITCCIIGTAIAFSLERLSRHYKFA